MLVRFVRLSDFGAIDCKSIALNYSFPSVGLWFAQIPIDDLHLPGSEQALARAVTYTFEGAHEAGVQKHKYSLTFARIK